MRLERREAEIASRVRRVCEHLTEEEFRALVHQMAQIAEQYERITAEGARLDALFAAVGAPRGQRAVEQPAETRRERDD